MFFQIIFFFLPFLLSVAFITLTERKILSLIGNRLGPNKVSFEGLAQPIMDALKLINKQTNTLSNFSFLIYYLGSSFLFCSSIIIWGCLTPFLFLSSKHSILLCFFFLSINSLGIMVAGWSVFSKFSLIGSIRTVSSLISYESILYLCLIFFLYNFCTFSFWERNFSFLFNILFLSPLVFFIWGPSVLADLNRSPFDFSEGESELVSGFNTEFGSSSFTLLFLAEYSNVLFFSVLTVWMFCSSKYFFFSVVPFLFILWIRSVLPRYRFDKLMLVGWKILIPLITVIFLLQILELN